MGKRSSVLLYLSVMLSVMLAACNSNENNEQNHDKKGIVPMGYYSNEHHGGNGGDVKWLHRDNDGPLTEMMDHSFGEERSGNRTYGDSENNRLMTEPMLGDSDRNYHGHLNERNGGARSSYYTAYDGKLAKKISEISSSVANVGDARSIVYRDHVLVGVMLEDPNREQETKAAIKDSLKDVSNGKKVNVVTNESAYSAVRDLDNSLREGEPIENIEQQMRSVIEKWKNNRENRQ